MQQKDRYLRIMESVRLHIFLIRMAAEPTHVKKYGARIKVS